MTSPRPPLPPAQTSPVNQDKLNKIKRKLKETLELNESLQEGFLRAKKKIKTLTFERNLLLDRLASMNNNEIVADEDDDDISSNISSSGDGNLADNTTSIEAPPPFNSRLPQQHYSSSTSNKKLNHHNRTAGQEQPPRRMTNISSATPTTVASAPPKRSKINRINIKTRRVQPIERDGLGHPKLPQQIGVLTVLDLGTIRADSESFHNERYIFPVGYTVRRTYPSMIHPSSNTIITSTILDGGDGSPRFHVLAQDQPNEPIIANSATGAWTVVVRKSNEIRHREHSNSASGPDYYGFKHPTIAKMIQDLPGARQLRNYVWQNFEEMEPRAAKGVMAAAEKKRDNLEQSATSRKMVGQQGGSVVEDRPSGSSNMEVMQQQQRHYEGGAISRSVFEQHYPPVVQHREPQLYNNMMADEDELIEEDDDEEIDELEE